MKHAVWVYDQYHSSEESGNKCKRDGKKQERNERNKLGENLPRVWSKNEGEWDLQFGR